MPIVQALLGVKHAVTGSGLSSIYLCSHKVFPPPLMRTRGKFPQDLLHFLVFGHLGTPDLPLTAGISFEK